MNTTNPVSRIVATNYTPPTNLGPKIVPFAITATSDCFVFYVLPEMTDEPSSVSLMNAGGQTTPTFADKGLYNETVDPEDETIRGRGNVAFSVPIASASGLTIGGQWAASLRFDTSLGTPSVKVVERVLLPGEGLSYQLPLNVVVYATSQNLKNKMAWVAEALDVIEAEFQLASIQTVFTGPVMKPLPPGGISDDFWSATTGRVVADNACVDKVSLLFIEDLQVQVANEVGKAGGIPGPQGFTSQFSATLVRLPTSAADPLASNVSLLGFTAAHEIGHYLGLTHCSAETDRTNLMYRTLSGDGKGSLNDKQKFILRNMPVVQLVSTGSHKTKVNQVVVTIRTGTRWPNWADGPGTDMNVSFSLGSRDTGFERWELDNPGNDFESGQVDVFTLQAQNLFLEDIKTWIVSTTWSLKTGRIYLGLDDEWDFAHIAVVVDGTQVYDGDINQFMGTGFGRAPATASRDF